MRNFKRILICFLFVGMIFLGNKGLDYLLYPYTYTRADIHHMQSSEYEDLIVGTSKGKCGIDPEILKEETGHGTINVCQGGQYPVDSLYMVKEAARNKKISRVIYEVDAGYWATTQNQTADYINFFKEMPLSKVKIEYFMDKIIKADFRTSLFPWYLYRNRIKDIPENVKMKKSSIYKEYGVEPFASVVQSYREDGMIMRYVNGADRENPNVEGLWSRDSLNKDAVVSFEKLVNFCKRENIQLVAVAMPIPEETYAKYEKVYEDARVYFTEIMNKYQIPYLDYTKKENKDIPKELEKFADYEGHMYYDTAKEFSKILGEDLKELE